MLESTPAILVHELLIISSLETNTSKKLRVNSCPSITIYHKLFYLSLKKVQAKTFESIHVGDNYNLDYVPSTEIGMKSILIDRGNEFDKEIDICISRDFSKIFEVINES